MFIFNKLSLFLLTKLETHIFFLIKTMPCMDSLVQSTPHHSIMHLIPSVRYEDPGAVEGLAGALDTRLQVTGGVCTSTSQYNMALSCGIKVPSVMSLPLSPFSLRCHK